MKSAILIDEDASQRSAIESWLIQAGWHVAVAEDGEEGNALAMLNPCDLVICDLLSPRCNGFQLSRILRGENSFNPQVRIIVTTGGGYATDRNNALQAGADECLVKPLNQTEFMKVVTRLMNEGNTASIARSDLNRPRNPGSGIVFEPALPYDGPTSVRFWGVRGSIPTPGRSTLRYGGNTSCVEVRADGEIIILDAGSGIAPLGTALAEEFRGRPFCVTLLISHTHWDHIQGFPFFEPAYNPVNRVRIIGFKGAKEGLESTLSSQMESPYFPISMSEMPSNICIEEMRDFKFSIGRVQVEAVYLNHPGICVGYRLNSSGGSVAYLPDNEPYQRYRYHASSLPKGSAQESIEYARKQDQRLIDFITGVDALIIDSQYDSTEYPKRIGWGHGCVDDVTALALSAKVKRLYLFHHDPRHNDEHIDSMLEWSRNFVLTLGDDLQVFAAEEGVEVVLNEEKTPSPSVPYTEKG